MAQTWDSDELCGRLVRAGVDRDHALRTVTELSGHLLELEEEERASGEDEAGAREAACRRMGDPRKVLRRIIRSYRRRFFMGRHPLFSFGVLPLFVSLSGKLFILTAVAFPIFLGWREPYTSWLLIGGDLFTILINVSTPIVLAWMFLRAARRRAVGFTWRFVAAIGVAVACQVAWVNINVEPGGQHGAFSLGHRGVYLLDVICIALALAAACVMAGVLARTSIPRQAPREQIPIT